MRIVEPTAEQRRLFEPRLRGPVKHRANRPENAILQNNPMHRKIVLVLQSHDYVHLGTSATVRELRWHCPKSQSFGQSGVQPASADAKSIAQYQRPRPYQPPPPSRTMTSTMMSIVVISMFGSYESAARRSFSTIIGRVSFGQTVHMSNRRAVRCSILLTSHHWRACFGLRRPN
jgi:hypothetical protein